MNATRKATLARLALGFLLAAPLAAADHVKLKDGKALKGRTTGYDAERKVLSFRTEDGKELQLGLDQLDQRSVYMVNSSLVPKDSGKGQLQLANYARDVGLYAHAGRRYEYAEKADPTLKAEIDRERGLGRKLAADACMKNARDAIAKKDIKDAEHWLALVVQKLPNEPQAAEAADLLEQHYLKERGARDDALEREHSELLQGELKKGKELYDRMLERTRDGLTAKNSGKAQDLWEGAIKDGEAVLKEIDKVAKKHADDPRVQEGAAKYRELTRDQLVDAHLHLASDATINSSYKEALKHTNAALSLAPDNQRALAQRARIQQASSEGLGLDWF
jgi:hypothetical protein